MEKSGAQMEFEAVIPLYAEVAGEKTVETVGDSQVMQRRQALRLAGLAKNFDRTVRDALGDEVADRFAREQRAIARKKNPPNSRFWNLRLD